MVDLPSTPSFRLDGKKAFVTGGSSGIGLGCAVALAEVGAHVVIAARGKERLDEAVAAINAKGMSAEAVVLDVSDIAAMRKVVADHGPFDVLVNCAGIGRHSKALDTTEEDFDFVADVNWKAAHFVSGAVAKGMIDNGIKGSIIHISSQMGHVGGIDRSVYCGSKHAVEGMVKSMAIEWGEHGLRVNTVCPTFIRTPLTEVTFNDPEKIAWVMSKIKLGRVGMVEDIMGAVAYLATDASSLVTGTSILVDGGWTAG